MKVYCKQKMFNLSFKSRYIFNVYLHIKENGNCQEISQEHSNTTSKLDNCVERISKMWNFKQSNESFSFNSSKNMSKNLLISHGSPLQTHKHSSADMNVQQSFAKEVQRKSSNQQPIVHPKYEYANYEKNPHLFQRQSFHETA